MRGIKEIRGITLIALVITIIILLILAGVTIITLTGENGLLERTKKTVEISKNVEAKETLQLMLLDIKTRIITEEERETNIEDCNELNGKSEVTKIEYINTEAPNYAIVTYKGYEFKVDKELVIVEELSSTKITKLIPKLSSQNESSELDAGQCWADIFSNGYEGYKAFDEDENTSWYLDPHANKETYPNLYYNFGKEVCIHRIYIDMKSPTNSYCENKIIFYISNDNVNYTEIYKKEWTWGKQDGIEETVDVVLDKPVYGKYIKIYSELKASLYLPKAMIPYIKTIQVYGTE